MLFIMRKTLSVIWLPLLLALVACGTSNSSGEQGIDVTENILQRLNEEGSFDWVEDRFAPVTGSNVENIYTAMGCSVWVFANESEVKNASNTSLFDFYDGELWYGADSYSPKGVALLTTSKNYPCAKVVFKALNWTTDNSLNDSSSSKPDMSGKWGSDGWMYDGNGMFVIIEPLGEDRYEGTFYSQGQSGGVFRDISIQIEDVGIWASGSYLALWKYHCGNLGQEK